MKNILQDSRALAIFDVPYLYHSTFTKFNAKIDYEKLMEHLADNLGILIIKAIAFVLDTRGESNKGATGFDIFIDKLEHEDIDVIIQKPRIPIDQNPKSIGELKELFRNTICDLDDEDPNIVTSRVIKAINYRPAKTDCNLAIAVEAITMANKVDLVILGSGNGEFLYLVEKLKGLNVNTVVLGHKETISKDLLSACHNDIIEITGDQLLEEGR